MFSGHHCIYFENFLFLLVFMTELDDLMQLPKCLWTQFLKLLLVIYSCAAATETRSLYCASTVCAVLWDILRTDISVWWNQGSQSHVPRTESLSPISFAHVVHRNGLTGWHLCEKYGPPPGVCPGAHCLSALLKKWVKSTMFVIRAADFYNLLCTCIQLWRVPNANMTTPCGEALWCRAAKQRF